MKRLGRRQAGFTIPELLVAMLLTLAIAVATLALVDFAGRQAQALPGGVDVQQRARVAVDVLSRAIRNAGAGFDGGLRRGPLGRYLPGVVPRRLGSMTPDAPHLARSDALTTISILDGPMQTSTTAAVGTGALLAVQIGPGCSAAQPECGAVGGDLIVFDEAGRFDLFGLVDLNGTLSRRTASGSVFAPGAAVASVSSRTYYLDPVNHQLREYDNDRTDTPLADDVTAFTIEYLGRVTPPIEPVPPLGTENCLYDSGGSAKALPILAATDGALALLPLPALSDGPWCGAGDTQFDADLLRVVAVRVTLRVRSSADSTRGTWRQAPDLVIAFVVSLRNEAAS